MLEDRWAEKLNICSMSRYDQAERLLQRVLMHSHDLRLAMQVVKRLEGEVHPTQMPEVIGDAVRQKCVDC